MQKSLWPSDYTKPILVFFLIMNSNYQIICVNFVKIFSMNLTLTGDGKDGDDKYSRSL